jgi:hypothetical protein
MTLSLLLRILRYLFFPHPTFMTRLPILITPHLKSVNLLVFPKQKLQISQNFFKVLEFPFDVYLHLCLIRGANLSIRLRYLCMIFTRRVRVLWAIVASPFRAHFHTSICTVACVAVFFVCFTLLAFRLVGSI